MVTAGKTTGPCRDIVSSFCQANSSTVSLNLDNGRRISRCWVARLWSRASYSRRKCRVVLRTPNSRSDTVLLAKDVCIITCWPYCAIIILSLTILCQVMQALFFVVQQAPAICSKGTTCKTGPHQNGDLPVWRYCIIYYTARIIYSKIGGNTAK